MSYKPQGPQEYQGKQVIINSDRLLFNAKEDSIFLFSNKSIGFSTNGTINFDITTDDKEHKGVFNIPYIFLGPIKNGKLPNEPALLGNKTEKWLGDLLNLIEGIIVKLQCQYHPISTNPGTPTSPNPAYQTIFKITKKQIKDLRKNIKDIKSPRINLL